LDNEEFKKLCFGKKISSLFLLSSSLLLFLLPLPSYSSLFLLPLPPSISIFPLFCLLPPLDFLASSQL
jgi:hypothetical protein